MEFNLLSKEIIDCQPYFIYQRINLGSPICYFLFALDYGYWYALRQMNIKYPSDDGVNQYNNLDIFAIQKGINKENQNVPIPINLLSTPNNSGVVNGVLGNSSGTIKSCILQNVIYPFRDTIELQISGHAAGTIPFVDICLMGYYLPVKENVMWS